tara:strand:+ start:2430 stop:2813 length:384 start_codon:yes stop_codon:yes gene_type:complete
MMTEKFDEELSQILTPQQGVSTQTFYNELKEVDKEPDLKAGCSPFPIYKEFLEQRTAIVFNFIAEISSSSPIKAPKTLNKFDILDIPDTPIEKVEVKKVEEDSFNSIRAMGKYYRKVKKGLGNGWTE